MEQGRLVEEWLLVVVGRPPVAGRGHLAARLRVMGLVGIPEGGGPEAPEEDDEDERGRQKTESGVVRELATRIYRSSAEPGGPHPVRLLHRVTSRDRQAFRHVPGCALKSLHGPYNDLNCSSSDASPTSSARVGRAGESCGRPRRGDPLSDPARTCPRPDRFVYNWSTKFDRPRGQQVSGRDAYSRPHRRLD